MLIFSSLSKTPRFVLSIHSVPLNFPLDFHLTPFPTPPSTLPHPHPQPHTYTHHNVGFRFTKWVGLEWVITSDWKTTVMITCIFKAFCLKIQLFLKNIHPSTEKQYHCLYTVNIWNLNLTIINIQPLISGERRPLGVSFKVKSNKVYTTNISFACYIETGSS